MTDDAARPLSVYVIAGEASGDLLGAHLMRALAAQSARPIKCYGIGGPRMEAEGLKSLFPFYELSMMGFLEILPYIFNISARIHQTVEDVLAKKPDVVITIDSPGFCFRVVKRLRKEKLHTKFVHYVAPTVWAYKPQRAEKCAKLFDHLLVLLPFEPPYFERVGLPCTFVGHPVVAETRTGDGARFREKYTIPGDALLISVLPGSRRGEVQRHIPIFGQAITLLARQYPRLAIAVAVPHNVMAYVTPYFKDCPFQAVIMAGDEDKKDAMAASDFSLVKSGTVSLEVAMAGTPMIIAYKVNAISAWLLRRMLLTRYVNLLNILEDSEIIPELLQENCTALLLANAAAAMLVSPAKMAEVKQLYQTALSKLVKLNALTPSNNAAQTILHVLNSPVRL